MTDLFDPPPLHIAHQHFEGANLAFPPIPNDLVNDLRVLGDWVFGTRTDAPGPYNIQWFIDELLEDRVPQDYVIFGHAGHGMNSYAMHYHLVRGPLAIFDQMAWGGVYMDNELQTELIDTHFSQIQDMIEALDEAQRRRLIPPDEQFIVILSDFYGSRWARRSQGLFWNHGHSLSVLLDAVIAAQQIVEDD